MKLNLQVTRLQDGAKVPVHVVAAGKLDFQQTASMGWQTNWKTMDTAYFQNRVALKTEEQELLGFERTLSGLLMALMFLLLFHWAGQCIRKCKKINCGVGKEQAYPLVTFLLLGMLMSVRIGA